MEQAAVAVEATSPTGRTEVWSRGAAWAAAIASNQRSREGGPIYICFRQFAKFWGGVSGLLRLVHLDAEVDQYIDKY